MSSDEKKIIVRNCTEHNLKSVDVEIPHHQLTVVTGVSGSGKSSLVFDTICKEGQRRYLESFSAYARQFLGKLGRPSVGHIEGLSPAIAVDQKTVVRSPRSTVGTLTELYDFLRLLFARLGNRAPGYETLKLERSLFSFNSPSGACPLCKGLGVQDRIDTDLLIADPTKTLRQGALVITTPSGYIIYSQVTMDVLNRVCEAHGFNVDIPWQDMTEEQKKIVLDGSDRIKIPYGKHPLESRLKWSGITAKPREEGYYKGILPVMENILRVSRNKNILRFARSMPCEACNGTRLNPEALAVTFRDLNIAQFAAKTIQQLHDFFTGIEFSKTEAAVGESIREVFLTRASLLEKLGLGYLTLDREATTLSGGEAQRIRLSTQVGTGLRGILYILDEPSIGLHHRDNARLLEMMHLLRDNGNTVIVVEHDEDTMRSADRLIDIGPGAGIHGGEILFNGPAELLLKEMAENDGNDDIKRSRTHSFLTGIERIPIPLRRRTGNGNALQITGAQENNLKNIDVSFPLGVLNVVTGVSGAGKSTLVHDILANFLKNRLHRANTSPGKHREILGIENIDNIIEIDQSPIGRTPRSNPATYTKLFDHIRDLFASLPESGKRKWDKGRFSFNVKGGRCESCEGAGLQQIGMHFLGNVDVVCEECGGKRFNDETLEVRYNDKSIFDVLEMPIHEAAAFFTQQPKISRILTALLDLGLGYIALGQSSTTLSGGEAQRIKLAAELCKPATGKTLYILDEPTTGLHAADIKILLESLNRLVDKGNTVITVEHHPDFIKAADWVVDLGPESGQFGGRLVAAGTPEHVAQSKTSFTGAFLREMNKSEIRISKYETNSNDQNTKSKTNTDDTVRHAESSQKDVSDIGVSNFGFISDFGFRASDFVPDKSSVLSPDAPIILKGVSTHNLKNIDVEIPVNTLTVITGVSGSGKSSLAFDTIFAEGRQRFLSSFSTYARRMLADSPKAEIAACSGLMPTIAVSQKTSAHNPRSTVATMTEIYDYYRLLYARVGKHDLPRKTLLSSMFSFNHHQGACTYCKGLGIVTVCDPDKLVTHPDRSLIAGALDGSKTGAFYGDPYGQHTAILQAVEEELGLDFSRPWVELDEEARRIAMYGTGDKTYTVTWKFKRKNREGEHRFETSWKGFVNYVNEEYERKHADNRGLAMLPLMMDETCPQCKGLRLKPESLAVTFARLNIAQLCQKTVDQSLEFFKAIEIRPGGNGGAETDFPSERDLRVTDELRAEVVRRLEFLQDVGLGYLTLDRNSAGLSGGEAQRIRLAGQLGSRLTGVTYVLDEPTIGLHARDTQRLLRVLKNLRDTGNTVIVVEHDAEIISAADFIIDLGPDAGREGGRIVAQGTLNKIKDNNQSKTGKYLKNPGAIPIPGRRRPLAEGLRIARAYANNLKDIDIHIPSRGIIVLTGVSGSGKSTLMFDVIAASAQRGGPVGCRSITTLNHPIVTVNQDGIGAGPSSNPATYTGLFDKIRELFAATQTARDRGYKKNRFSFNVKGGRCETCRGMGEIRTSMDFLSDVWTVCEDCKGKRYNEETLQCTFQSKSIADVLEMTVAEALEFFSAYPAIINILGQMEAVGLGYLKLGRPGNTLSGGEAQRLKLVTELIKGKSKNVLYLFDEPTTGLHFEDVLRLLGLFHRMADAGHTLLIIEHHPDIIKNADYVIDLGPEGGDRGGRIAAMGTPEEVAGVEESYTGKMLKSLF